MRVDIHCHLIPQKFWDATLEGRDWYGATLDDENGYQFINTRDRKAGPVEANWMLTLEERVAFMDSIGVDTHVLSAPPYFFNYHLPIAEAIRASREINDEISEAIKCYPRRFSGLATVPMQDIDVAINELERTMGNGLKGVELCTHVNGRNYDDPEMTPFFQAAEEMGAFMFFHPHAPTASGRTDSYYLANAIGNPLETAITMASLIFGGVLDRFPDLKLCFAHGGGYGCFGIGRMDRAHKVRDESKINNIRNIPSSYLKHMYFDCLTHSYHALHYLLKTVTPDNVMMGSDFPFDMGFESPVKWILDAPGISNGDKAKMLGGNASKLLGLS